MSLRIIHVFLIAAGLLLSVGTGYWALSQGGGEKLPFAIVSLVVALATLVYGVWFVRRQFGQLK
ncbi:MAG: hypothetical protein SFU85_08600 [Candidatus Methylacidiphilales bacterium]|nr:hypothetical protein [Candidatus Methylacidiphilales bacterium]